MYVVISKSTPLLTPSLIYKAIRNSDRSSRLPICNRWCLYSRNHYFTFNYHTCWYHICGFMRCRTCRFLFHWIFLVAHKFRLATTLDDINNFITCLNEHSHSSVYFHFFLFLTVHVMVRIHSIHCISIYHNNLSFLEICVEFSGDGASTITLIFLIT